MNEPAAGTSVDPADAKSARPTRGPGLRLLIAVLRLWPFAVLLLLFVLWTGWVRTSAGGAAGGAFSGTIAPAAARSNADGRFRVGIYNIQGAVGKQDAQAIDKLAGSIGTVDFCGLCEVRGNSFSTGKSQAEQIGRQLGWSWLFAPAERRFWRDYGGNGIVSRVPVTHWTRIPLPASTEDAGSNRNVTLSRVMIGGKPVTLFVTHIDRGRARAEQLLAIAHLLETVEGPAVLLGDLNSDCFDPAVSPLLKLPGVEDVISRKLGQKKERVDWILARGLTIRDAGIIESDASDHAFFWAELELPH